MSSSVLQALPADAAADPSDAEPTPVAGSGNPLAMTIALALLVLVGLAFYLVCSHQVRQAEARQVASQVQQTAFSDCLQYVVGSTIGSCVSRLGAQPAADPVVGSAAPQLVVGR